jgi:hypothetical protein
MTLVLTEISPTGIVMATDSAITKFLRGKIVEVDQQGWKKLLYAPKIQAGVSYWGMIGAITQIRFDQWLQRVIQSGHYSDLSSFANHIAATLNTACGNRPLPNNREVGVHVAGYAEWEDGQRRPFFYHVHNGHGTTEIEHEIEEMSDGSTRIVAVHPKWISDPRKLFEKHQDFPRLDKSLEENLVALDQGFLIRNGDYFMYMVIWDCLQQGFNYLNLIPGVSIPRDPTNLGSRKGLLHAALETTIRVYRCSNQSKIIGGTVTSLGIGPKKVTW